MAVTELATSEKSTQFLLIHFYPQFTTNNHTCNNMKQHRNTISAPSLVRVPYPQTPETASTWIKAHGITVTDLARQNQLPRLVLVDLLRKRLVGNYGQAHRAAIVLGLKPAPERLAA